MKSTHKKPFSGKQKKQQLQDRRERKKEQEKKVKEQPKLQTDEEFLDETKQKVKQQIYAEKRDLRPRMLGMETKEEIDTRKQLANNPIDLTKRIEGRTIPLFDVI